MLFDQTFLSTTSPQEASARTFDGIEPYDTVEPLVPWYDLPGACTISPCRLQAAAALPGGDRYAYTNVDSDQDALIDGFERLLGTNPNVADIDCDGASDCQEAFFYDRSNPNPSLHGYGDPQRGPCSILFADNFESGNLDRWMVVP